MFAGELDLALAPSLRNHVNQLHSEACDISRWTRPSAVHRFGRPQRDGGPLPAMPCGRRNGVARPPAPTIHRTLEISGLLDVLNVQ